MIASMRTEPLQSELARLQREQTKTRQDEVFGGLSPAERSAYDHKQDRIQELEYFLYGADRERQRKLLSSWETVDQDYDDEHYDLKKST
jgi:hypothetical protein